MSENQHDDRDARIAQHEAAHLCVGRALGAQFGGATIEENTELGFSGLCWGPDFESRFAGDTNSSAIEQIAELMPCDGDVRDAETAPIFQHVVNRVTELTAGSEGEKLAFGDAWTAADDRAQERKLASLIYSSSEAAEAFIAACALEARAILQRHADVVDALAAALVLHRTLDTAMIDSTISGTVAARQLAQEHERRRRWSELSSKLNISICPKTTRRMLSPALAASRPNSKA
jgi:hypothetical protein